MGTDRSENEMDTIQKIGLLGGTFDPVHNGHLEIAVFVRKSLQLDRVWFVPAALSPHKHLHQNGSGVTPFIDRLAMLEAALREYDDFEITLIETERAEPSYTIDTFREIDKRQTGQSAFYFILGQDAFEDIGSWKEYEKLLDFTSLVVLTRDGSGLQGISETINRCFPELVCEGKTVWHGQGKNRIIYLDMEPVTVSSSMIRESVVRGNSIDHLVNAEVAEYIAKNKLYISEEVV